MFAEGTMLYTNVPKETTNISLLCCVILEVTFCSHVWIVLMIRTEVPKSTREFVCLAVSLGIETSQITRLVSTAHSDSLTLYFSHARRT